MIIAHRGGGEGVSENRLETIKDTLTKSYVDAVEVDLRLTKDNILVIHHDRGVYINGRRVWIDRMNYADIKYLGIPTFEEVATLFRNSNKILNIDVKDSKSVAPLKKFLTKIKFD